MFFLPLKIFQLIVFPWLLRSLGCRHTFQIGIICLFVYNILLPFSTVISGPIQASPNYNETYIILSEFCNDTSELSLVRPDSVTRITWNVWFWMIFINAVGIAGRYCCEMEPLKLITIGNRCFVHCMHVDGELIYRNILHDCRNY